MERAGVFLNGNKIELCRGLADIIACRVNTDGVNIIVELGDKAGDEDCDRHDGCDQAQGLAGALAAVDCRNDAEDTGDDAEDGCNCQSNVHADTDINLALDVGFLILQVLLCLVAENLALFKVEHRVAVLLNDCAVLVYFIHVGDDVLAERLISLFVYMCAAVFLDDEVVGDLEAELDCQILRQGLNGLLAAVEAEAGLHAFKK